MDHTENADLLARCRVKIDMLDRQIAGLLAERFAVSDEIGRYKAENELPVRNAAREAEVLASALTQAGPPYADDVAAVYETFLARSRQRQDPVAETDN